MLSCQRNTEVNEGMLASPERQRQITGLLRAQSKRRGERGWPELPAPVKALVKNDPFALARREGSYSMAYWYT